MSFICRFLYVHAWVLSSRLAIDRLLTERDSNPISLCHYSHQPRLFSEEFEATILLLAEVYLFKLVSLNTHEKLHRFLRTSSCHLKGILFLPVPIFVRCQRFPRALFQSSVHTSHAQSWQLSSPAHPDFSSFCNNDCDHCRSKYRKRVADVIHVSIQGHRVYSSWIIRKVVLIDSKKNSNIFILLALSKNVVLIIVKCN